MKKVFLGFLISVLFILTSIFPSFAQKYYTVKSGNFTLNIDTQKYKGKTIYMWQFWPEEEKSSLPGTRSSKEVREEFEKITGAKVKIVYTTWENYRPKLSAAILSGSGADVVYIGAGEKPTWMMKKMIIPLNKYINFKDKNLKNAVGLRDSTTNFFTWRGQVYAITNIYNDNVFPYILYYNKEKFEMAGLQDPLDLYKKGKWTWDVFFDMGKQLTQDTNGDGKIDQYAYATWAVVQPFLYTNDVEIVKYIGGKPVFAMDSPKAYRAFQAVYDMDAKYKMRPADWWEDPQGRFQKGVTCMDYWGPWELSGMRTALGKKLGIVPFPKGPDGKKKSADMADDGAWAIASSSKDPELAALWLTYMLMPTDKERDLIVKSQIERVGGKDTYDLLMDAATRAQIDPISGIPGFWDLINQIDTANPAKSIKALKPKFQAAIDSILEGLK
ncbi:MAG TPA: extracellular solute-binding protein [Dictyoglomaceae bacterium]|mgnify:CR=1 FL=1|nr:extracellular solute-binding protein [Dictyoglomaceae bacterium]HOL39470.1 extracellular solute-binding protein [Dictyoglomaceae bacterium]HPP15389.1 extracellular solute-binding protein [Dictyoglomaceae bacterium]HPU44378.1 extracellular solute-binding protein [Dictyoglomaceae bacterium]